MRIAVLGTVMHDEIITARGERRESFGGILYNIMALVAMTGERDSIQPFCYVSTQHREQIIAQYLAPHRRVVTDTLFVSPEGTDSNVLNYRTASDREEKMTLRTPPLSMAELEAACDANVIVVNLVNAREIDLPTLRQLRMRTRAHIHLDIHNLGKALDETGRLVPRGLPNWREWLACVDSVQANEWEMQLITGVKPESEADFRRGALVLASPPNIRAAVLTIGGRGCALASRVDDDPTVHFLRIPALEGLDTVDTTGCGDSFSSAFVVTYERKRKALEAALVATALSGLNTTGGGLDALAGRNNAADMARTAFPALWVAVEAGWPGETIDPDEIIRAVGRIAPG